MGLFGFRSKKTSEGEQPDAEETASVVPASAPAATETPKQGWLARMRARLNRGDSWLTYDLANLLPGGQIDETVRAYTGADAFGVNAVEAVNLCKQWREAA